MVLFFNSHRNTRLSTERREEWPLPEFSFNCNGSNVQNCSLSLSMKHEGTLMYPSLGAGQGVIDVIYNEGKAWLTGDEELEICLMSMSSILLRLFTSWWNMSVFKNWYIGMKKGEQYLINWHKL